MSVGPVHKVSAWMNACLCARHSGCDGYVHGQLHGISYCGKHCALCHDTLHTSQQHSPSPVQNDSLCVRGLPCMHIGPDVAPAVVTAPGRSQWGACTLPRGIPAGMHGAAPAQVWVHLCTMNVSLLNRPHSPLQFEAALHDNNTA